MKGANCNLSEEDTRHVFKLRDEVTVTRHCHLNEPRNSLRRSQPDGWANKTDPVPYSLFRRPQRHRLHSEFEILSIVKLGEGMMMMND